MDGNLKKREILRFQSSPDTCPYLADKVCMMEFRFFPDLRPGDFQELLQRGWRKQGASFFRPLCPRCSQCVSLRVDVDEFRPSKSQRKALNRNPDVQLVVQPPTVTREHIDLYNAYHADMQERRGWPYRRMTPEKYYESFLMGDFDFTREFLYYSGTQLVGVGIVDLVPHGISSVYFYHHPSWRDRSPGTFTVLQEIEYARQTARKYVYLGYWVKDCPSMTYKARFTPHELLKGYPTDEEQPVWETITE